ncbi:C-type mannose receptor 2 [Lamellibrachia satsuma]|nr:C-type mannose receptor 2 [Lamellibrachia satsuma]
MSSNEQETEMTWVDARASCMQQGADLVSVNSIAENDFLKGMLNESSYQGRLWTGLNQRDDREHYRWSDGSGTDFNDWSIDQPVQTGRQQCACLSSRPSGYTQGSPTMYDSIRPTGTAVSQFRRLNGVNTMWGLLQKPSDAQPPRTFKFGFRYDPYRGADWCEQMCDRQIGCFSYTFMNPYMSNITWVAECMGRSNFTDVQVNDPDATSGIRQALPVGTWFSANCGSKMGFICKKPKGSDVPLTVAPTTPAAGYCPVGYFNVSGEDWAGALEICRRGPGYLPDLASISSEIENAAITLRLDGYAIGLWLGLHQSNGLWSWTDNSAVDFTKWAPGEPSINTGDCGEMWTYPGPSGTWNNVLCSKMRGYVCQTFKDPAHPVATPPSTTLNRCPDGYANRHGEACYRLLPEPVTWIEASRQCQSDDAHLVSIHSPSENAAVFLMVGGPLWIGLKQDSGEYKWTDGWPDDYTNWEAEEPGSGDGCIAMNAASKWTDSRCNVKRAAVCKKTTALLPTTPTIAPGVCPRTGRWAEFGGHCYYFSSFYEVPVSWTSAKLTCRQLGAHLYKVSLTSIHSSAEQDFIYNTWKKQYSTSRHSGLWVGLRSHNSEDTLRWTDNSALQYSHWAPGEPSRGGGPDGPTKQCMMLHTRSWPGLWHLQQCDRKGGYVCKTEKLLPPTTPTLPPEVPGECPSGADWQSYGTFCYAFKLSYALSWEEAQDECVKHGGPMASLASIRHSSENWFVWQKVQELAGSRPINAAWIGLKKDAHEVVWHMQFMKSSTTDRGRVAHAVHEVIDN